MSVTTKEFKEWFQQLVDEKAIYVWGMNGVIINRASIDKAYNSFKSQKYDASYYETMLAEGEGKIGADCSGAFYPLTQKDNTAAGYYNACTVKGLIADIPNNKACMVFNKNKTHIGAYLGDGYTIEMKSTIADVHKEKLNKSRWYYFGIPDWIEDQDNTTNTVVKTVETQEIDSYIPVVTTIPSVYDLFPLGNYVLLAAMIVRKGPSSKTARKTYAELTADGRKHAYNNGTLKKDTVVTVKQVIKENETNYWALTPSGYIAIKDAKKVYMSRKQ